MRCLVFLTLFTFLCGLGTWTNAAEPTQREITGSELIVQAALDELEAPTADISHQSSPTLATAFPNHLFVLAQFDESAGEDLPSPLQPRSLYVVPPDGTPQLLATPEDVLELFKTAFKPIKTAADAKQAALAALALEQAKYPGQPFAAPTDLEAQPSGQGFQASGSSQPTAPSSGAPTGSGPLSVNLSIGAAGQPTSMNVVNMYRPPARRRTITSTDITNDQTIAQQVAGGPVTNINSPTINKYFPGQTVYRTPAKPGKKRPGLVVVDPSHQPHVLPAFGPLFQYVKKQSGPLTSEQKIRDAATTFLTLVATMFPEYTFDPVGTDNIVITPEGSGGFEMKGMIGVSGDKSKWFKTNWHITAKGKIHNWVFHPKGL